MENPWKKKSSVNPQKEDGHREISNPVFQALIASDLSGAEYKVIMAVIDRSWGFSKQSAKISLTYFTDATGISRRGIINIINELEEKHLIVTARHGTQTNEYLFNKHFDTWAKETPPSEPYFTSDFFICSEQASEPYFTSLVNPTSLDWCTLLHYPSEVPKAKPSLSKETFKETFKETSKEKKQEGPKTPDPLTEKRAKVFEELKKRRGYNSPCAALEAKAITWMLKQGYTVEQVMKAHDILTKQPFWKAKFLNMQSVKNQIGAILKIIKEGGNAGPKSGEYFTEHLKSIDSQTGETIS